MSNRYKFSPEVKAEYVELLFSFGRPVVQVAKEIGVSDGTLGNWVRPWKEEHPETVTDEPGSVV